jgi:hypothetical protein
MKPARGTPAPQISQPIDLPETFLNSQARSSPKNLKFEI